MAADEDSSRDGLEQRSGLRGNQIGAQDERGTARAVAPSVRSRLARSDRGFQGDLKFLDVGRTAVVQDDEVDGQLLQPPVLVRPQYLPNDVNIVPFMNLHEYDWQIARYSVGPER